MKYIRTITPTEMRIINRSAILDLIRRESPTSRSAIADKLDVSLPTVMRIVDELMEEGLVRPLGTTEWSGGRRRSLLEFNAHGQVMIGIDLGGVNFYGAVADLSGKILYENFVPAVRGDSEQEYERLVEMIDALLAQASQAGVAIRGIGVGIPGVVDYEKGIVRKSTLPYWRDFPLRQRLVNRFNLPVIVENDVNLSALGEVWFGTEQNVSTLAMILIGNGLGVGTVVDGVIYRGAHQAAGELGFIPPSVEHLGKSYPELGAMESLVGAAGIIQRAQRQLESQSPSALIETIDIQQIFAAYAQAEPWAQSVINETADYLAIVVANVALCFDPDVIVLGGEFSQHLDLLVGPIMDRVHGSLVMDTKLVASCLGRRAAVMGAVTNVLHHTSDFYALRSMA